MKTTAMLLIGLNTLLWSNFIPQSGVVKDISTNLEWQNNFKNNTIQELKLEEAISYCQELDLNGKGWRLPTKDELLTLVERYEKRHVIPSKKEEKTSLNPIFFNKNKKDSTGYYYWSSTPSDSDNNNLYWAVNFQDGWTGQERQNQQLKTRCVRGEFSDNIPMAKIFGVVKTESEPFSEEEKGILLILGEPNSTIVSTRELNISK
jgi:hypothetical protein